MLQDYFLQEETICHLVKNDDEQLLLKNPDEYDALVVSPGPATPQQSGYLMQVLQIWANIKPILGVCLGHQAIGIHFGAELVRAKLPRHGKVDEVRHLGSDLFKNVPERFLATRYHSLVLQDLPPNLEPLAWCDNELMALRHRDLPLYGLQFHPESCQTAFGKQMIKNFLEIVKNYTQI